MLFRNFMNDRELRRYRGLCDLHGQCGGKPFPTRELRADQDLWDLQAPISAAGDIFGRKLRCAARSRDVADGSSACSRNAFRRLPFGVHRSRESNPGACSAIAD